jgi:hypothetical protein
MLRGVEMSEKGAGWAGGNAAQLAEGNDKEALFTAGRTAPGRLTISHSVMGLLCYRTVMSLYFNLLDCLWMQGLLEAIGEFMPL